MSRINFREPQNIHPSLIEIGDDIAVTLPGKKGVTTTVRGIVATRIIQGGTRFYSTEEGGTILAFDAKSPRSIKVQVYSRETTPQETLFESDLLAPIKERMGQ